MRNENENDKRKMRNEKFEMRLEKLKIKSQSNFSQLRLNAIHLSTIHSPIKA